MIQDPEDELLDQSLRETFSDFDLPPSSHVWAGVEGHLAALPTPPRAVPYKLLLPVVGAVGVGIGWLLAGSEDPAPVTSTQPLAAPRTEVGVATREPLPVVSAVGAPATSQPKEASQPASGGVASRQEAAKPGTARAAGRRRVSPRPAVVAAVPAAEAPVSTAPVSFETSNVAPAESLAAASPVAQAVVPATTDSEQAIIAESLASPETLAVASASAGAARSLGMQKAEAASHGRTEYRVPTHRMAEKGRGVRRRFSHLTQKVRQLFSPRRSRAAAQPDF